MESVVEDGDVAADFFAVEVHLGTGGLDGFLDGALAEAAHRGDGFAHALLGALKHVAVFAGDGGKVDAFAVQPLGGAQRAGGRVADERRQFGRGLGGGGDGEEEGERPDGKDGTEKVHFKRILGEREGGGNTNSTECWSASKSGKPTQGTGTSPVRLWVSAEATCCRRKTP